MLTFNSEFKLISRNPNREVQTDKEEFQLPLTLVDANRAILIGICEAYGIRANSKTNKSTLVELIQNKFKTLTLKDERTTMSDYDQDLINQICTECHNSGVDEDSTMQRLVTDASVKIKDVARTYTRTMKELGFIRSPAEIYASSCELLTDVTFENPEDVSNAIAMLAEQNKIEVRLATMHVKKFAKQNDVKLPKPEKQKRQTKGVFIRRWVIENVDADENSFIAFLTAAEAEGGAGVSSDKQAVKYLDLLSFAKQCNAAWNAS